MNEPDAPPLPLTSAPYERWTRRLARGAAVGLALSVLLPLFWIDDSGALRTLWAWQRFPEGSWALTVQWLGEGPPFSRVPLLMIALAAWVGASREPLARRGRWLAVTTMFCLLLPGTSWGWGLFMVHHAWGHFLGLVLAGLGLALSGTTVHGRLGGNLLTLGGLLLLVTPLWPVNDWSWPDLRSAFDESPDHTADEAQLLRVVLTLLSGLLSVWAGVGRAPTKAGRRLVALVLAAMIVATFAVSAAWHSDRASAHGAAQSAVTIWNTLRFCVRPHALALLMVVGLFAWIVGSRQEPAVESVFD